MKKWSGLKIITFVAVGVLLPHLAHAEYGMSYGGATNGDVNSTLRPLGNSLNSYAIGSRYGQSAADSFSDAAQSQQSKQLEEELQQGQQTIKESQEEFNIRQTNEKWRKQIDKNNQTVDTMKGILVKRQRDAQLQNEAILKKTSQLQASAGVSPGAVDTSSLDPVCKKNVDFSQFKQMAKLFGSKPFELFKTNASRVMARKNKKDTQNFLQALSTFRKSYKNREQQADNVFQEDIQHPSDAFLDAKGGKYSLDRRVKSAKDDSARLKPTMDQSFSDVSDTLFDQFVPALFGEKVGDKDFEDIKTYFVGGLQNYRSATYDAVVQGASQIRQNCENTKKLLGSGLQPSTVTNDVYQAVSKIDINDANAKLGHFQSFAQYQCSDATSNLESLFGGSLESQIDSLNQIDPNAEGGKEALIQGASNVLEAIRSAESQVDVALASPMRDCQKVALEYNNWVSVRDQIRSSQVAANGAPGAPNGGAPVPRQSASQRPSSGGSFGRRGGVPPSTH